VLDGRESCGVSTGEALSRWCAAITSNNALSDFATAPTWAMNGMPDYVNQTDPTDQSADSTGCGMAFLSWIMSQGYSIEKIAPAMVSLGDSGTFAQLYAKLTGDAAANAWPNFQSAIQHIGGASAITSDDPFGAMAHPARLPHLPPWTVELAGKVFAAILADIAAGKTEHQIVASVRARPHHRPSREESPLVRRLLCEIPRAAPARHDSLAPAGLELWTRSQARALHKGAQAFKPSPGVNFAARGLPRDPAR
jgi:hypothetical protein